MTDEEKTYEPAGHVSIERVDGGFYVGATLDLRKFARQGLVESLVLIGNIMADDGDPEWRENLITTLRHEIVKEAKKEEGAV